ncbi:MAG: DUF2508 family protein [Oscillospiraceae bacterium]
MKASAIVNPKNTVAYHELELDANRAKRDVQSAMQNFENVSDPDVVDIYIYELRKAQTRYDHIIRELKSFN